MPLIVGLGNPGSQYASTRHNIGQRIVSVLTNGEIKAHLFTPRSFMNSCGPEIGAQLRFHKLSPSNLLVVHDELDLPFGELRLQFDRSSAGHHGVDSIIATLGTAAFWRLRVGIGPRGETSGEEFVLERFSKVEEEQLPEVIKKAQEIVSDWLKDER